ncbi:MAG: AAA family ATPase [Anaerolineales bacterium]
MKLIVFSGLPGTGKTALAEKVACELGIPVFAKDWLEATLLRCELVSKNQDKLLGSAGYHLLTVLAERQLMLGQSVILDSVASTKSIRSSWRELAEKYHAEWSVIECTCSDEKVHRARLCTRQRGIPGWHELDWPEVKRVKGNYHPWDEDRLILDAMHPLEDNLKLVFEYLSNQGE